MKRLRVLALCAGTIVLALVPILAAAMPGPTRVGQSPAASTSRTQSIAFESSGPVNPTLVQYAPPGSATTPEIISRAGEILGAINNPDRRSQLAEQWLQYSKQVIAKDQEFRDSWLEVQKQQLAQQQETEQLHLQIAQLQARIEELRAQNLQLEQETLQMRQSLAPGASAPTPRASARAAAPQ